MLQTLPTNDHRLVFQQEPYKKNLCLNKIYLENLQTKRQKKRRHGNRTRNISRKKERQDWVEEEGKREETRIKREA